MELRQLRYFVAVADAGNISRAAEKIFLTQPALSRQIKALEDEIGQALLERQAHSVRLTPAGEALLEETRDLLQRADRLLERARAAGRGPRLRVGYAPSLAAGILSSAVASFSQAHASARVELCDLSSAEMLAGLENGQLDAVITIGRKRGTRGLKWTPLLTTPWMLAVGRHHRLADRARVTATEVAEESLLVFCQRDYPEYWDAITGWMRSHRLQPRIAGEYDGGESLMAGVESGLGVALVTTSMARLFPGRARLKPLSAAPPPVCIQVGYRLNRTDEKPLAVFIEELRRAARAFG